MAAYWFVDRIMGKVIDSLFDYLKDHYSSQIGMEKECERLRFNYLRIKSLVSVAENQIQITDPVARDSRLTPSLHGSSHNSVEAVIKFPRAYRLALEHHRKGIFHTLHSSKVEQRSK